DEGVKVVKRAPLIDLTLEEMRATIVLSGGTESLLERLKVDEVLAHEGESIDKEAFFPATDKLIYYYDFGDGLKINITKHENCNELLECNLIDQTKLKEAEATVIHKHQPVCIYREGISVLDDIGGLGGFA